MAGNWGTIAKEYRRASVISRIGRHVAWEILTDPKPTDLSRVPPGPDSLTTEFLTAVMCAGHPHAKVTSITLGERSAGSAERCAFKVTYNAAGEKAGLQKHLFLKYTQDFYNRLHMLRSQMNTCEPNFYKTVRPTLEIEAPKSYYAELEDGSCRSAIVLEDVIALRGATFYKVNTPFERDDIEGMLTILAELHGRYWQSPKLDTFKWLVSPKQMHANVSEGVEYPELTPAGIDLSRSVLPPSFPNRKDDIWNAYVKSMDLSSQGPITYIQGDPHLRNYYKTAAGVVGLADWQVNMKGSWTFDFAYTMLTSCPIEKRRAWEKDLLAFYLKHLKARGGNAPAFADAWESYRRQVMYTLVAWLVTIGFGALQPNMQPADETLEIIRRAAAAVDDLGTLDLLLA